MRARGNTRQGVNVCKICEGGGRLSYDIAAALLRHLGHIKGQCQVILNHFLFYTYTVARTSGFSVLKQPNSFLCDYSDIHMYVDNCNNQNPAWEKLVSRKF